LEPIGTYLYSMSENNKQDEHQSKFDLSEHFTIGVLNPEDLTFFYYDIGKGHLENTPFNDWDTVVNEFSGVLDIDTCTKDQVDEDFIQDKIRFTASMQGNEEEPKAVALFRHLRNAFAHYHIVREGENYCLIDKRGEQVNMRGLVKAEILKDFCFRLLDQGEKS